MSLHFFKIIGLFMCVQIQPSIAQNNPLLPYDHLQWQFENKGQNGPSDIDIDLTDAWKLTTGGLTYDDHEIVVAVIDRGVLIHHADLEENIWKNTGEIENNGIDDDKNGFIDDIHGWNFRDQSNSVDLGGYGHPHGTPINGIIGAVGNNHFGVTGINQSVKLLNLVRGVDTASVFACYDYLYELRSKFNNTDGREGALVVAINHSWGMDSIFGQDYPEWCERLDRLGSVGVLSVAAVPNDPIDIDVAGDLPATCKSPYLITVTNSDHFDQKVDYAAYGKESVDLTAPGYNSYTTLNNGDFGYFSGTSASAPYVTGTIGLIHSIPSNYISKAVIATPGSFALIVKNSILSGVDKKYELRDFTKSGGRLNVYNALAQTCMAFGEEVLMDQLSTSGKILSLYPNPTKDFAVLSIDFKQARNDLAITLMNNVGTMLEKTRITNIPQGIQSIKIDMSRYENGLYLMQVISREFEETIKIVKI